MTDISTGEPEPEPDPRWHAEPIDEVLRAVNSRESGLNSEEVETRRKRYGWNKLPETPPKPLWLRILSQFHNLLIYLLLVAGVVNFLLKEWIDAGVIFAVVLINGLTSFIQEGKAERALNAIRNMLSLTANVRRNDELLEIPARELVPGDIVFLQSGDKVPADMRLIEVKSLSVEEASLTGESHAVEKREVAVDAEAPLGDRLCMAYSGTLVVYGQAYGVVTAIGSRTELGKIDELVSAAPRVMTPLLKQLNRLAATLTIAILAFGLIAMVVSVWQGLSWLNAFKSMIGLAVASIPEGLPTVVTVTLAIGVQAMARRHAIIRRLPAVETLGSVSVICSDKTGTLTRNEMTATRLVLSDGVIQVEGTGYIPQGRFVREGKEINPNQHSGLVRLLQVGVGCNDSRLRERDGSGWSVEGDPTEGALLALAGKAGWSIEEPEETTGERIDSIPFESQHKYMATLHQIDGKRYIFLKGASEEVMRRCDRQWSLSGGEAIHTAYWDRQFSRQASEGLRLIGMAYREVDGMGDESHEMALSHDTLGNGFTFLGLVGLMDPPREEVIAAVARCHDAGITVKMITGDHALTAQAIGFQLGLRAEQVVTGEMLERASQQQIEQWVRDVHVFARVSPEHKLRLVEALQRNGEVTAMTGDGVNDAPALKTADVGIAMGIKGTEAAKEAAGMVLTDDNFASISSAVEVGRTVYDNLKKSLLFILPTSGGQALVILVAMLLGIEKPPITTAQILWVNMIIAVTFAVVLSFEPAESGVMKRPPRNSKEPILSGFFIWRIAFVSILLCALSFGIFEYVEVVHGWSYAKASALAVNAIIIGQAFYLLNCRSLTGSMWVYHRKPRNRYIAWALLSVALAQVVFTYTPWSRSLFDVEPFEWPYWCWLLLGGFILFALVEFEKGVIRRMNRKDGSDSCVSPLPRASSSSKGGSLSQ
jgi:magnesium-transporting ATPase (P-type)